jgi:uncharacterized membrane protein YoaK (UPF0700 family)
MIEETNHRVEEVATVKRWAWIRIVLGWLQMAGAAASLVLLASTGARTMTVVVAAITGVFMLISVVLFRVLKMPRSGRRQP